MIDVMLALRVYACVCFVLRIIVRFLRFLVFPMKFIQSLQLTQGSLTVIADDPPHPSPRFAPVHKTPIETRWAKWLTGTFGIL